MANTTKDRDLFDSEVEAQEATREAAQERLGEKREALGDPTFGWTVQEGPLGSATDPEPQQRYTADQLPDPGAVEGRSDLAPQQMPEHLVSGGVEGTGFVDWTDEEGNVLPRGSGDFEGVGPMTVGDRTYNYSGRSTDWTDPNVGWTAVSPTTEFPRDYLHDPQTKGLFSKRIYSESELPDADKIASLGFKPTPGVSASAGPQSGPSQAGGRQIQGLVWYPDADAALVGHPRGPEPLTPAARATTRNAIRTRLNDEVGYADVVVEAGADQTVAQGAAVTLTATASGVTGATYSYQWRQTAGDSVTLSDDEVASPTFTAPAANTTLVFEVEVEATSDAGGANTPKRKGKDRVQVTVGTGSANAPVALGEGQSDHPELSGQTVPDAEEAGEESDPERSGQTAPEGANWETANDAINTSDAEAEADGSEDAASEGEGAEDAEADGYETWTVTELKTEARERELSGYSTLNKDELIEMLEKDDKQG